MYTRIIVALDLQDAQQGKQLLDHARGLLDEGGELHLVHVLEEIPGYVAAELPGDIEERRRATSMVELRALTTDADARAKHVVLRGGPSSQIIKAAQDSNADLIMIASHKPGFGDYFIGSTAARVVRHSPISVLVIR